MFMCDEIMLLRNFGFCQCE
jgi:hypothetical protein